MDPQTLHELWADALRLLHEHGISPARVDAWVAAKTGLPSVAALQAAAFPADRSAPDVAEAPSIGKTAATQFGHGASMSLSDELAGLMSAIAGGPTQNPVQSYIQGRDENRAYLEAGRKANPRTALISNLAGAGVSGALLPVGAAATGTDLLPAMYQGAKMGAGVGAVAGVGSAGDVNVRGELQNPVNVAREAAPAALLGAGLGAGGAFAGRALQTAGNPAAARGEEIMGMESGNPSVTAAVTGAASDQGEAAVIQTLNRLHVPGTPPPLLAEGGPALRTEAAKFVARSNPKAREAALRNVQAVLDETSQIKQTLGKQLYGPLNDLPVVTKGVNAVIARNLKLLRPRQAAEVRAALDSGKPLPMRLVNIVRKELKLRGDQGMLGFQRGVEKSTAEPLEQLADAKFLDLALRNDVPGFADAQATIGPYRGRERGLQQLKRELSTGRGRVMPSPGSGAPSHALKELLGSTFSRNARAAQRLVDVLFTPREPEAQIAALHALRKTFPLIGTGGTDLFGSLIAADVTRNQQPVDEE